MVIPAEVAARLEPPGGVWRLYGRTLDDGDVLQVTRAAPETSEASGEDERLAASDAGLLGLTLTIGPAAPEDAATLQPIEAGFLVSSGADLKVWVRAQTGAGSWVGATKESGWQLVEVDVVHPVADFFARTAGVLESDLLREKSVAVIGLGTGGSLLAVEMARCGVGRLVLVDFDRLETHNIARHACGLRDVGRLKTRAVRDLVLYKSPYVLVETHEFDVLKGPDRLKALLSTVDLVLAATDSEASKMLINRLSLELGVPAVYGGAYERALGGDVIRVIPGQTPCYDCVIGQVVEELGQPGGGAIDYSTVSDPSQIKAEPGLGLDVAFIALIQAKVALWTLLAQAGQEVPEADANFILWGNRKGWIFERPFQCALARTEKRAGCPTCGRKVDEELVARAQAILAAAGGTDQSSGGYRLV